jgi:hypothetical protein
LQCLVTAHHTLPEVWLEMGSAAPHAGFGLHIRPRSPCSCCSLPTCLGRNVRPRKAWSYSSCYLTEELRLITWIQDYNQVGWFVRDPQIPVSVQVWQIQTVDAKPELSNSFSASPRYGSAVSRHYSLGPQFVVWRPLFMGPFYTPLTPSTGKTRGSLRSHTVCACACLPALNLEPVLDSQKLHQSRAPVGTTLFFSPIG